MKKIAWLLDVDGVINVQNPTYAAPLKKIKVGDTSVYYDPDLIQWMRTEPALKGVQLVWCSDWCYDYEKLFALEVELCISKRTVFPAYSQRPAHFTGAEQKVAAVQDYLNMYSRVIWTDDREVNAARDMFPDLKQAEDNGRLLMIQPDGEEGLTSAHMATIAQWVKGGRSMEDLLKELFTVYDSLLVPPWTEHEAKMKKLWAAIDALKAATPGESRQ